MCRYTSIGVLKLRMGFDETQRRAARTPAALHPRAAAMFAAMQAVRLRVRNSFTQCHAIRALKALISILLWPSNLRQNISYLQDVGHDLVGRSNHAAA